MTLRCTKPPAPRVAGLPPDDGARIPPAAAGRPPNGALAYPLRAPPAPGTAVAIAPRLLWLRMPLPFVLDHINLWLLQDSDDAFTLVDSGYGDEATRALWRQHFATTLSAPIRRILVTHCHPDHVGNAAWLSSRFDAPVSMTNAEFLTAHALVDGSGAYSPDAMVDLFRRHGIGDAQVEALGHGGNRYARGVPDLPATFDRLIDGDRRAAGGATWRVVEGHGHSPEHASLHSVERGVLVSGDMLLPKITTNVSVYAVEPEADPLGRFLDSLDALEELPDDTLVLPSHGLPFRGVATRIAQLRAHHDARLAELEAALRASAAPASAAELVPVLFRRELDGHQLFFAMGETIAHLNFLWHRAAIERRVGAGGSVRFAAIAR